VTDSEQQVFVSVVVPTHQRPESLRTLLESLWNQSYPHGSFEVIVVPTSGDGAAGITGEFAGRGRISLRTAEIPGDPWEGRSASAKRNFGVSLATGEWIAFIDDDCVADKNWLAEASRFFSRPEIGGIEGRTEIPPVDPITLTYKGLCRLSLPGGYQTCNMFYRRTTFLAVGGFDLAFPFYLEDTDVAWSILDLPSTIVFAERAVVSHPVPPPAPWRLLDGARRNVLMPYLRRKHPDRFRRQGLRMIPRRHWPYLAIYALLLGALASGLFGLIAVLLAALIALTGAHSAHLFRGCRVELEEWLVTTFLLPVVPLVSLLYLLRGLYCYRGPKAASKA